MGVFEDSRAEFTAAFDSADDLGDTVKSIEYVVGDTKYPWRAILLDVKAHEVDGEAVKITDTKFLMLQHEQAAVTEPHADDWIDYNGRTYYVIHALADPANITWQVFCRA